MPIEVEPFDDLDAVARDAAGALDRAARASLFQRLDWYRLTATHAAPPGRPLILRARDGDARAWLFLSVEGERARALASWYTLHFQAALDSEQLAVALARAIRTRRIASVELYPLVQGDILPWAFRMAGWLVSWEKAGMNWRTHTEGLDFATYWSRRPARLRNTIQRKARAAGMEVTIHRSFDCSTWAAYEAVYRASWKPPEGSPAFLRALAEQEGAAGTLRLGIMRWEGEPIAAQLWLVENGVATIHKLAHVEATRALSPGTVLTMAMFRHVIGQDRPDLIDFGTGNEPYKADWMDERRPLFRMTAFEPRSVQGLYGAARRGAAKLVRSASSD
jgi:CelD/BcsL family acetyltransferase involved in cellulose biosynthesis